MDEQFNFRKRYKGYILAASAAGMFLSIFAIIIFKPGSARIWANILLNNQLFLGITLGAAFFIAVHRISLSGWHTFLQNIPDAMTAFLPVAFLLMLLLYFGMDQIYYWSHFERPDPVLEVKKAWLNMPFFFARMVVYFAGWTGLVWLMRKSSLSLLNSTDIKFHNRRKIFAGLFLAYYGITVTTSSWDWLMSLDAHWDSTVFGWYVFIGMFVTALTVIIIITWFLKREGYLKYLRTDHIQDLGILLFSFSIFWTYLWFSQYLLIWYGHIPQETSYYIERMGKFKPYFFINLVVNFLFPFFCLIRVSSKRHLGWLTFVASVVLIGHWIDYWLMIMPATAGDKAGIGMLEVSMTLLYAGIFLFVVFRSLARYPMVVKNDPFLEESMNYEA